jgi:Asp-tRNA(Asn)/Glu-tRNA(Gln) amidotransferase A subunit family amidase
MHPYELGLTAAAIAIRERSLTAAELARSVIERSEEVEPELHAMAYQDSERLLQAAREIDRRIDDGESLGAIAGIPMGVKDIYDSAGVPTTHGVTGVPPNIPAFSAPALERLYAAGAVLFGKTATTERAFLDPAKTRNPWKLSHTPGGSSSGSAAGVASRMFPVALGSQTAGSVIRPASFCGIIGMTLTPGRVPISRGVLPLAPFYDMPGFFVRSVEDAELFAAVWCGVDSLEDLEPLGAPDTLFQRPAFLGFARHFLEITDDEAAHAILHATRTLSEKGSIVHVLKMPESYETFMAAHRTILAHEASQVHRDRFSSHPQEFGPHISALIQEGREVEPDAYRDALKLRDGFRRDMLKRLAEVDAIVLPATTGPAPAGLASTGDPSCNSPWTAIGFPAITLPCAETEAGLPLGLQIVGRPGGERALLWVAKTCEKALGHGCPMPSLAS